MKAISEEYLAHYGVLGMKWGIRRLEKKVSRAKASGNTKRVNKLNKRLAEQKQIQKLELHNKLFLTRAATLANIRMMIDGKSTAERLIKLHGINYVTNIGVMQVSGQIQKSVVSKKGEISTKSLVTLVGGLALSNIAGAAVKKKIYDSI